MAARTVVHAASRYRIADDDPARDELLPWAVLRANVIDELTLRPPLAPLTLTSTLRGARAQVVEGGICGLVARPRDVAAALVNPGGFTARVSAPGYLPRDLTSAIEAARRTLNAAAPAGTTTLDVVPTDPAPRLQFTPGRGMLLERPVATDPDQFTRVAAAALPPPGDVPLRDPVDAPRAAGARVAGVPLALPVQPLHRDAALSVRGRVQLRTGASILVPALGASVGILGLWWDHPSSVTGAPLPPEVCVVEPPLRLAHQVGASVHRCTVNPVGGARVLRAPAPAGADELVIAPNTLLNPLGGDLLEVGDPLTPDSEVVVSAGFTAAGSPAAPVRVRLRAPTGFLHREGEPVQAVQAVAINPVGAVAREALPGDRVLFAPGLPALPTVSTLILEHPTPRRSFHRARQVPSTPDGIAFSHLVLPDATGRFEWPPLARIAQLRVVANLPPHPPVQVDLTLDFGSSPTLAIIVT